MRQGPFRGLQVAPLIRRAEDVDYAAGYSYEAALRRRSLPRFAPYETVTGERATALALYEWDTDASAVVFHAIGMVEVLLRNSLSDVLGQMFPILCLGTTRRRRWDQSPHHPHRKRPSTLGPPRRRPVPIGVAVATHLADKSALARLGNPIVPAASDR